VIINRNRDVMSRMVRFGARAWSGGWNNWRRGRRGLSPTSMRAHLFLELFDAFVRHRYFCYPCLVAFPRFHTFRPSFLLRTERNVAIQRGFRVVFLHAFLWRIMRQFFGYHGNSVFPVFARSIEDDSWMNGNLFWRVELVLARPNPNDSTLFIILDRKRRWRFAAFACRHWYSNDLHQTDAQSDQADLKVHIIRVLGNQMNNAALKESSSLS